MSLLSETAINNCSLLSTEYSISLEPYIKFMLYLFKDSDMCGFVWQVIQWFYLHGSSGSFLEKNLHKEKESLAHGFGSQTVRRRVM